MGHVAHGTTTCFRQVEPAAESPDYREEALLTAGTTVLAHVRRATVGDPEHENTHPFRRGSSLLVHNGHIPAFDRVRPRLLDRLDEGRRHSIRGSTDSEHVFVLLLQLREEQPDASLHAITRRAVHLIQDWVRDEAPDATVAPVEADTSALGHDTLIDLLGLNLLWTDGDTLGGARLNRTLWALERDHVHMCPLYDDNDVDLLDDKPYHSTTLASERLTDEDWTEVPNGSVFHADDTGTLHLESLEQT
jgi:glutamine amidotransferase